MKALIVYNSKKGKTAHYARNIAMHLWKNGFSISLCSTDDYTEEKIADCDLLVTGCWTSGWFVINQYPNKLWRNFAKKLPKALPENIILFTTYKFRTGSMFRNMKKQLNMSSVKNVYKMKSKTGILTNDEMSMLDEISKEYKNKLHRD